MATYAAGASIADSNGNVQTCTTAGKAGTTEPTWPTGSGQTTSDGTIVWTSAGQVAPTSNYIVDSASKPPRIFPIQGQYWPACLYVPNAVAIHFTAGYGTDASSVPNSVKVAIKQLVAHWYKDPSAVGNKNLGDAPQSVDMLLGSLSILDFAPTRG